MEKYDYYTIKAAWKGAGVSQRADDIKAAEKIAADLKGNGFIDVVIFGVKAGKREKLEGGKQAKPKAQERPRKAKKPKAQAKAAPNVKTPVNAPKKQEKKAQDNAGQLDLFIKPLNKKFDITFTNSDLIYISFALGLLDNENKKISSTLKFKELKECILKARNRDKNVNINLDSDELNIICNALQIYHKISFDDNVNNLYKQLLNLSFPYSEL